jgi:hypothetical protein
VANAKITLKVGYQAHISQNEVSPHERTIERFSGSLRESQVTFSIFVVF